MLSSGWRRPAPAGSAPPRMPSPRGRHGRPGPGSSGGGALLSAGGGSWWHSPGAGESWRRDAPESGGGWSVFFSARTGESSLLVGGNGWRYGAPSSVSSPELASGGSPRLESRDLERALPVSWASRLGCVEDLSLPRVARFVTGSHVACCLYGGQRKERVRGKVAGWERRVKKLWRQIYCCGVPAVSSDISVFQQTARYRPRLRPASVMVAATPTSRIKDYSSKKGTIHQTLNIRAAPSLTVRYTGNARTNRSESSKKLAALTLTAMQGVQHSKGTSAAIALKQA